MKFRGAGQGPLALVAEIIAGELARRLGLRVPDLVLADLDPRIPGSEPDPEIQDLLRASEGLNPPVRHPGPHPLKPPSIAAKGTSAQNIAATSDSERTTVVPAAGTFPSISPLRICTAVMPRSAAPAQYAG